MEEKITEEKAKQLLRAIAVRAKQRVEDIESHKAEDMAAILSIVDKAKEKRIRETLASIDDSDLYV